jgi:hypothetical protein
VSAAKEVQRICAVRTAPRTPKGKEQKPPAIGKKAALIDAAGKPSDGWGDLLN